MARSKEFPTHYEVGVLNGKKVYRHPQMGLAIEQDHRLVEMSREQLEAWFCQERDAKMLAEIEERRREELEEIGHGLSSGRPHKPMIIRRDIE